MRETSRSRQEYVPLMVGYFLLAGFRLGINIRTQKLLRGAMLCKHTHCGITDYRRVRHSP